MSNEISGHLFQEVTMVTLIRTGLVVVAGLLTLNQLLALQAGDENAKVKVEFRRAETEPAKGLTEAVVAGTKKKIYLHKTADATNEDIAEVRATVDGKKNPAIEIVFTKDGAKKVAAMSKQHKDRPLAIMVDGKVLSAPILRDTIQEKAMITGHVTKEEVDRIVKGISSK
jgi:preprotein translocase subunit SecD